METAHAIVTACFIVCSLLVNNAVFCKESFGKNHTIHVHFTYKDVPMIIFGTSWYRGVLLSIPFDGVWEITKERDLREAGERGGVRPNLQ